jgi:hypothetical protein
MIYVIFEASGDDAPPLRQKAVCYSKEAVEETVRCLYRIQLAEEDADDSEYDVSEEELFIKWYENKRANSNRDGLICAHAGPYEVRAYPKNSRLARPER